jgi:hypothetical protein
MLCGASSPERAVLCRLLKNAAERRFSGDDSTDIVDLSRRGAAAAYFRRENCNYHSSTQPEHNSNEPDEYLVVPSRLVCSSPAVSRSSAPHGIV